LSAQRGKIFASSELNVRLVLQTADGCFDENGILYHIATKGKTAEWVNPHAAGWVKVKWSSVFDEDSHIENFVSGPTRQGFSGRESFTKANSDEFMMVDLKTDLLVDYYALRNGHTGGRTMRNWVLEGAISGPSHDILCLCLHMPC
jgi:hypothetical protein